MESRAVVFTGANQVEYRGVACPEPGPEDVVVEVHHSWISNGTEGSFLRGERIAGDTAWRPGDPAPFPMIAGYQKVGRVMSAGSGVRRFAPGDWVFASVSRVAGMFDNQYAGHVSPAVCHQNSVMMLPKGRDPVAFSPLVLAQVGYNCGSRAPLASGEAALIVGDGLVGQWAGQTLAQAGARVVMLGRHADRLARFARHGTTLVAGSDNGLAAVKALKLGAIQVLVETSGRAGVLSEYLPLMARGGHFVIAGFYAASGQVGLQASLEKFRHAEMAFDLVSGWTQPRLDATLERIADGRLDTLGCLTHRFPVERAAEAWKLIQAKTEPVLGVVLDWPAAGRKP